MGIPVIRTRFWPRPMILPSLTTTAPNGPPHPFSTDSIASRVASWANCFLYSLLSMSTVLIYFAWAGCVGFQGGNRLLAIKRRSAYLAEEFAGPELSESSDGK